jgi:hypothetical protein
MSWSLTSSHLTRSSAAHGQRLQSLTLLALASAVLATPLLVAGMHVVPPAPAIIQHAGYAQVLRCSGAQVLRCSGAQVLRCSGAQGMQGMLK